MGVRTAYIGIVCMTGVSGMRSGAIGISPDRPWRWLVISVRRSAPRFPRMIIQKSPERDHAHPRTVDGDRQRAALEGAQGQGV